MASMRVLPFPLGKIMADCGVMGRFCLADCPAGHYNKSVCPKHFGGAVKKVLDKPRFSVVSSYLRKKLFVAFGKGEPDAREYGSQDDAHRGDYGYANANALFPPVILLV